MKQTMTKQDKEYLRTATESQLKELKVPWFKTIKELNQYISILTTRKHDYGTCVYAMSMCSLATYYYTSSKLDVTGFQARCADLDFITRTSGMKHGFMIVNYENLLYPQYDLLKDVEEQLTKARYNLKGEALKLLANNNACPEVVERWEEIAKLVKPLVTK